MTRGTVACFCHEKGFRLLTRLVMSPRIVASVCAALLVLLSSCDLGGDPKTDSTIQPPSNAVCLDSQRDAFPGLVAGWRKVVIDMTAAGDGASGGLGPWTSALEKARASMTKAGCPDPPRELEPLTALTEDLNKSGQMTLEQAHSLGALLGGAAEKTPSVADLIR